MLVRAIADCFPDLKHRKKGEVFEYSGPMSKGGPLVAVEMNDVANQEVAVHAEPKRRAPRRKKGELPPNWLPEQQLSGPQ